MTKFNKCQKTKRFFSLSHPEHFVASSDVVAPLACPPLHGCSKRKGPLKSQLCWVCPFWATVESWQCNTTDSSPKEERHALKPVINRVITTSRDALMPPKRLFPTAQNWMHTKTPLSSFHRNKRGSISTAASRF